MYSRYAVVALLSVGLAACDTDDSQRSAAQPAPTPSSERPAAEPADAMNPERNSPSEPPAEKGTGLGTEFGTDDGEVVDPASGAGTGTTQ